MASALWHYDDTGYRPRWIAYYDEGDAPRRRMRGLYGLGLIGEPYLQSGSIPAGFTAWTPPPGLTPLNQIRQHASADLARGFRVVTDPVAALTWGVVDLVEPPEFTYSGGVISGIDSTVTAQLETAIFDENTNSPYLFGLDGSMASLLSDYMYPTPVAVGARSSYGGGFVLAKDGFRTDGDVALLLSHQPYDLFGSYYYRSQPVVINRGNGPERASYSRGPGSLITNQGAIIVQDSPSELYVASPFFPGRGGNSGTNHACFGLPSEVVCRHSVLTSSPPTPLEYKDELWLYSVSGTIVETLGNGTMIKSGDLGGWLPSYYADHTYDLTGYDLDGILAFQVRCFNTSYGGGWTEGNAIIWHKAPCGWPWWAIGEDPERELPYIPAPIFKRA